MYITTPQEAELNAAEQMRLLGFADARVTGAGADGGVDVRATRAIAQVKWRNAQAGRPELQGLFGARGNQFHKQLLFYAASGYTRQAIEYADQHELALFTFEPTGRATPVNVVARRLVDAAAHHRASSVATQRQWKAVQPAMTRGVTPRPPRGKRRNLVLALGHGLIALLLGGAVFAEPSRPSSFVVEASGNVILVIGSVFFAAQAVRRLRTYLDPADGPASDESNAPGRGRRRHLAFGATYSAVAFFFGIAVFAAETGQAQGVDLVVRVCYAAIAAFCTAQAVKRYRTFWVRRATAG